MDGLGKILAGLYMLLIFLAGFLSAQVWLFYQTGSFSGITGFAVSRPRDVLSNQDILVYDDRVVLKIHGARISTYDSTGSMEPVLGEGANGISIPPENEESVEIGDIVSFWRNGSLIVHRVVDRGVDELGVYYVTKGDNSAVSDGKVRFDSIEHVLVGIVY